MAISNFIPEVWADSMLDRWTAQEVLTATVNRQYEGTAAKGNVVHLTGVVAPTITDYKAAGRTTSAEAISDTGVDLLIDQEKSFDFYVDDIDRAQAAGSLDVYTDAASDALVADANSFLAELLADEGTPLSGSAPTDGDDAFDLVADAEMALSAADAPETERFLVVNPRFYRLLVGADSKLTSVDTSGDNAGLRAATVGELLSFRVVRSNRLPENDTPAFLAYHSRAAAFVSQLDSVEGMRAHDRHADRVRGLHVYGGKVVKPAGVQVFGIGS